MKSFLLALCLFSSSQIFAEVKPKSAAPDFTLTDLEGKPRSLKDFKGKWVVMEWFNKDCPYVKKHYGSSNMQDLQKKYTEKGVVWLTINSSAKGKQGYEEAAEALKTKAALKALPTHLLADSNGAVGKLYGAKTTPHMYIVTPEQTIAYVGAIDDNSSSDASVIPKSKNYVVAALDAGMSGKAIEMQVTKPYGCGVKY